MNQIILMTTEQANAVRGLSAPGHAIAPRPFKVITISNIFSGGRWGLPAACLTDPFHAAAWPLLKLCTLANSSLIVESSGSTGDWNVASSINRLCSYGSSWALGFTQTIDIAAMSISAISRST